MPLAAGTHIGSFEILASIGAGGGLLVPKEIGIEIELEAVRQVDAASASATEPR